MIELPLLDLTPVLRNSFVAVHAASAVIAFLLGVLIVVLRQSHPNLVSPYVLSLGAMAAFVTAAVALDWSGLTRATQGVFAALLALAGYTVWRGGRAGRRLRSGPSAVGGAIDDIGFTLITLFVGFVIILALDLGGPPWVLVVLGVLTVVVGRHLVSVAKTRRLQLKAP